MHLMWRFMDINVCRFVNCYEEVEEKGLEEIFADIYHLVI